MPRQRVHWIDGIANDLTDRIKQAIPAIADSLKDNVPVGYKPPQPTAELLDSFLALDGNQRLQQYQQMGPEQYRQYTSQIMQAATRRYGAAAQALMPMLEATEVQSMMAPGADQPEQGPFSPVDVARMQLSEYLGVDPLGGQYGT